ncbi:MAG: hypothetical protein ACOY9B_04270 [Pseudomonadota bacterium]
MTADAPTSRDFAEREFVIPLSQDEHAVVRVRLAANTPVVVGPRPKRYHAALGDEALELEVDMEVMPLMGNTPVVTGPRPVQR